MPKSCKEFKTDLVGQQDLVTPWEKEHVVDAPEGTDPDDYISRRELYDAYKNSVSEEQSKKTRIGERAFSERIINILGEPEERFKYTIKVDGRQVQKEKRSCWVGKLYRQKLMGKGHTICPISA